jgi:outer membrane protein OmpA-like peptidoglycan-associated protein
LELSQERADAVQKYLVARGISEDRLLSIGEGEAMPIADNQTRAGRRMNRRIEIKFRSPQSQSYHTK